jgi:ADP-ribose pyrophosphatase YjhB (NUDIX family)
MSKILPTVDEYIPHLAYDSVIFGFNGEQLRILILEYHNTGLFALPGGFVRRNENLDDAVKRGLKERTGLDNIYLEQFHTFGDLSRPDPDVMRTILEANDHEVEEGNWLLDRFISVAYYALINYNSVEPKPDELSDSINWYAVDKLPPLMMDHGKIVEKALETLRNNLEKKLVGMNLLASKFTMKELQLVYEAVLGEKLRRTTFQRKILGLDILKRHEKLFTGGAHKAPYLYSFKNKEPIQHEKHA